MKENRSGNALVAALKGWFIPQSSDPTIAYRERALRFLLPAITILNIPGIIKAYFLTGLEPPRYIPLWLSIAIIVIPFCFSFYLIVKQRIGFAGAFFLSSWYLMDMANLPADGYWHPSLQISLIIQSILATLLLPTRAILPFVLFQLSTVTLWGSWLNANYYDHPMLPTDEPVSIFWTTIITLATQETIITLIVRYLRLEMEKSLQLQQEIIAHLEERVAQRTVALEAKNKELEAFSYSVSHDLRAPLRAVNGFAKILKEDFADILPLEAQNHLTRISNAGKNMGKLIDELLAFSQIGRNQIKKQTIDLNIIVRVCIESLTPEEASYRLEWRLTDLPPAQTDPVLIQQVYTNLLNNAIKYSRACNPACIEVGSFEKQKKIIYFVRDNGAGFDMKYANKLFGVFQRLHHEDEFEGVGIGLAIVQRIIHGHGGRVWAEAEVGKGATFYFTLC